MRTKFDSTIAKALASTVLVSSCSPDASFLQPLSEHEDSTSKELNDSKGVSISLNINDKMREDLNNLEPLVNEILNDSTAAKEFAANPNLFCTQHGYAMTLDSNDSIMKVLVSLGNSDIRASLEKGDFVKFFSLCQELQIFDNSQVVQLNSIFKSKEEQKIFEAIAHDINGQTVSTRSVAAYVVVTVALVLAIVITITVGIADRDDDSTLSNEERDSVNVCATNMFKMNNPEHMIINMWALKHDIDCYQVVAGYKEFMANQVVKHLKGVNSPALAKYSEQQISEFLKGNMLV